MHPAAQLVATMLVVDPVCMMTCYPQLLANFVYKSPPLAGLPLLQKITFGARFLAARDLVIAQVFCRRCVTPCFKPNPNPSINPNPKPNPK